MEKSKPELVALLRSIDDELGDAVLAGLIRARQQAEAMVMLLDGATARLLVAANVILLAEAGRC